MAFMPIEESPVKLVPQLTDNHSASEGLLLAASLLLSFLLCYSLGRGLASCQSFFLIIKPSYRRLRNGLKYLRRWYHHCYSHIHALSRHRVLCYVIQLRRSRVKMTMDQS